MSRPDAPQDHDHIEPDGGRIEGWTAWAERVREVLALAGSQPASLMMVDEDFAQWPLGDIACVQSFEQWSLASSRGMRCTLLAHRWDEFARRHPRWLRWRATWSHKVECRGWHEEDLSSMVNPKPMLILQGTMGLQMLDVERGTGLWSRRPAALSEWWQFGDAISQRSIETMPVTTAGL
ncbi:MAG: hypothetical protein EOP40_04870 [Rubrivivax sp.]|nr:MAG: hypothetical protein EOP40_04870 [Rubrivivax sp.]